MNISCAVGLYVTDLTPSDEAGVDRARLAVRSTVETYGVRACAERLTTDYGERPTFAMERMLWAMERVRQCASEKADDDSPVIIAGRRVLREWAAMSGQDEDTLLRGILPAVAESAITDALTGLPTHELMLRQLAMGAHEVGVVVVVNLNDIDPTTNNGSGGAGDQQLVRAAQALLQVVGDDLVTRTGKDELTAFLRPTVGASQQIQRMLAAYGVSAAVGAVAVRNGDIQTAWQLADAAMYAEKRDHQRRTLDPGYHGTAGHGTACHGTADDDMPYHGNAGRDGSTGWHVDGLRMPHRPSLPTRHVVMMNRRRPPAARRT